MASRELPRVLVTIEHEGQIHGEATERLEEVASVRMVESHIYSKKEELIRIIGGYEGAIITSNIPFDGEVIAKAKSLRVVSRLGVGYDRIDVRAAVDRGITVTNTPVLSETVADLALGLLLAVARNILRADAFVRRGEWRLREERTKFTGLDVWGKILGVIGLGRVGSLLAERARCFGMKVLYHDVVRYRDLEEDLDLEYLPLDEVLSRADFISIHTPLNRETRGLIGEEELRMMKRSGILINTSRGPVVEEEALIRALREGWILGAGLDVHEIEPLNPENPLLKSEKVVLTPHIGAGTRECQERIVMTAVENTVRVLMGEEPLYRVSS